MGKASGSVYGSFIRVQISWQIFPLLFSFSFSLQQISSSGWRAVCHGTLHVVEAWDGGAVKQLDWKTVFGYF